MPSAISNATKEVNEYITSLPEFAKEICEKLRAIILATDKDLKEEWKWGPHYSLNGMVCGFSGFKQHAKLTFFNGAGMKDPKHLFNHCVDNEFSRSIKYTDLTEIDEKVIAAYVKESIAVNKKGYKRQVKDKTVEVPEDLQKALAENKKAAAFFEGLTYGYKKEFVEYVTEAKREETRLARIEKVVKLSAEGKKLNDKYK